MTLDEIRALAASRLGDVLIEAALPGLPEPYRGKVRDNVDLPGGRRIIVATDRQSAFDQVLAAVPFKGQVLTATARFWFEATADIVTNHVLAYPDPNVLVARQLRMLPLEVVVRGYLAGETATSLWTLYRSGHHGAYGLRLPDGLRRNECLPNPVITPTTKGADGAHDEPVSPDAALARGLLTASEWETVRATALTLFARGQSIACRQGLILVDTKYEFGVDGAGRVTLADEIHTPDSSRYWIAATYPDLFAAGQDPETLDKDFLRRWIRARCDPYRDPIPPIPAETLSEFAARYVDLFQRVTGRAFLPPPQEPTIGDRIRANLDTYLAANPVN